MGAHSKRKGNVYERQTATWYRGLGIECKRGWQSREGCDDPDVVLENFSWPNRLWIECKHHKKPPSAFAAMKQAQEAMEKAEVSLVQMPVCHLHQSHGEHLVVITRGDWGRIIGALESEQERRQPAGGE